MTDGAQKLTLDDERDISAVIIRYATGIDARDWALFRTCFTDDLHADYGAFGIWSSSDEIANAMEQMHAAMGPTLHRISNIAISPAAGGAVGRTYVDALLSGAAEDGGFRQGIGYYDDEFVKTATGWKIKSRRFTAVRIV